MNRMRTGEENYRYKKRRYKKSGCKKRQYVKYGYKKRRYDRKGDEWLGKRKKRRRCFRKDFKVNVGKKDDLPVHFCDRCDLPIKIYGRIIPCKHAFCYNCATLFEKNRGKKCPGCHNPMLRIEKYRRGAIFMCSTVQGCKRTYLSKRDLQAHINHRHKRAGKWVTRARVHPCVTSLPTKNSAMSEILPDKDHISRFPSETHNMIPPPPVQNVPHKYYNQPPEHIGAPRAEVYSYPLHLVHQETFHISSIEYSNLIIVPIQDDPNSGTKEPSPPVPAPDHHHPEYQSQPVASYLNGIMISEQYHVPLQSPLPVKYPMSYFPESAGNPYLLYNQRSLPMMSGASQISSSFLYINTPVPPYMNFPPGSPLSESDDPSVSEFPLYYYNSKFLAQLNEDQPTLISPFTQADGINPGVTSESKALLPYSPSPTQLSGSHHSDWRRNKPYQQ